MNLPKFSVRYPVTVAMLMLTIGILGFISFNRLGTDLLPYIQSAYRSGAEVRRTFTAGYGAAVCPQSRRRSRHGKQRG